MDADVELLAFAGFDWLTTWLVCVIQGSKRFALAGQLYGGRVALEDISSCTTADNALDAFKYRCSSQVRQRKFRGGYALALKRERTSGIFSVRQVARLIPMILQKDKITQVDGWFDKKSESLLGWRFWKQIHALMKCASLWLRESDRCSVSMPTYCFRARQKILWSPVVSASGHSTTKYFGSGNLGVIDDAGHIGTGGRVRRKCRDGEAAARVCGYRKKSRGLWAIERSKICWLSGQCQSWNSFH